MIMLVKGLCTGFFYTFISISAMILASHYMMNGNTKRGLIAMLGIITVQVIYAACASLILLGAFQWLHSDSRTYSLIGSIILFVMAVRIYRSQEDYAQKDILSTKTLNIYSDGFVNALSFPVRIIGYGAIFASLGIYDHTPTLWESTLPVIGVCLGSLCWWLLFTLTLHNNKTTISPRTLQHFHRYAALTLIVFSAIGVLQLYF